jgi:bacterioferritin-associated ferredoxin
MFVQRPMPAVESTECPEPKFDAMLVCQCNVITDREIKAVILSFLREDPWAIIVPAKVYRELEKRCKCSGCVPNVVDIITAVTEEYHLQLAESGTEPGIAQPRPQVLPRKRAGGVHERRSTGNRAA